MEYRRADNIEYMDVFIEMVYLSGNIRDIGSPVFHRNFLHKKMPHRKPVRHPRRDLRYLRINASTYSANVTFMTCWKNSVLNNA
jgi:hypothetical protein